MPEFTLMLADDHAIVREGIAALCASNGFRILGQCSDGAAAVELVIAEKTGFRDSGSPYAGNHGDRSDSANPSCRRSNQIDHPVN